MHQTKKKNQSELYKDANNQINDMIESCFRSGNVLGQKRILMMM